jgi:death-on-curing protein
MRYLDEEEIIQINRRLIEIYSPGEMIGVKSSNELNSAVMRPQQSAFGEDAYPDVYSKAAALFESLGQNHPFQNANKRTAFTTMVIFLHMNRKKFTMAQPMAEDFTVNMVNHQYPFDVLVDIIKKHSR